MKILCSSLALLFCMLASNSFAQQKPAAHIDMFCTAKIPHRTDALDSDTSKPRGLVDGYFLWNAGQVLKVRMYQGSKMLRDLVMAAAKEWEKYANVRFEFVDYGETHIRILLAEGFGHNSSLGIQCKSVPQDEQTMNIDTSDFFRKGQFLGYEFKGTVMHELGHSLGFLHEHFSPVSGIKWNKEAVYRDIMESNGWSKEQIDYNLFQQFNTSYTHGTTYDKKSVMHYYILSKWTFDGYYVNPNYELSDGDKEMARISYPADGERKTILPRFTVTDFAETEVIDNPLKQGFSYFPSFDITTAGRQAKVVLIAYILDEDYRFIAHAQNPDAIVGTLHTYNLAAGKTYTLNRGSNDVEFFIPYSAFDLQPGINEFNVYFVVKLIDGDEEKYLLRSNPVAFSKTIK